MFDKAISHNLSGCLLFGTKIILFASLPGTNLQVNI